MRNRSLHSPLEKLQKFKPAFIIVAVVLVLFLLGSLIAPSMVDEKAVEEELIARLTELTGRPPIMGSASVSVFPKGVITIDGLAIANSDNSEKRYFLNINTVKVYFSALSALSGSAPKLENIELDGVQVELERYQDGSANWELLKQTQSAAAQAMPAVALHISNAAIQFTQHQHQYSMRLEQVAGNISLSNAQVSGQINSQLAGEALAVQGNCLFTKFQDFTSYDGDCLADVAHGDNKLSYRGRVLNGKSGPSHRSQLEVDATDARTWLDLLLGRGDDVVAEHYTRALPLTLRVDAYADTSKEVYNFTQIKSLDTIGKASLSIDHSKAIEQADVKMFFDRFDLDALLPSHPMQGNGVATQTNLFAGRQIVPQALGANLAFSAKQLNAHGVVFQNARIQAKVENAEVFVGGASAQTAGQGQLSTIGILKNTNKGLQYEGQVEAHGNSLQALAPVFDISSADIPPNMFTQYRGRFNVVSRPDLTTVSELRLVAGSQGDMQVSGGINFYREAMPRVSATLAVRNIDLDAFDKQWRGEASYFDNPAEMANNPLQLLWLKRYKQKLNLSLSLADYTWFGTKGRAAKAKINIEPNKLSVQSLDLRLGDEFVQGDIAIEHRLNQVRVEASDRPFVQGKLAFSYINLGNAFRDTITSENGGAMQDSVWSNAKINLYPLHHLDGSVALQFDEVKHERFTANNVQMNAELNNKKLTLKNIRLRLWDGNVNANVELDSSVVSAIIMQWKMENIELRSMLQSIAGYENIGGRVAATGVLRMSGVNFNNWLDSMHGQLSVNGANASIRPFNLQAVARGAFASRSVADFKNTLRAAQQRGSTSIPAFQLLGFFEKGKWNISKSQLQASQTLATMSGFVDIRRWVMNINTLLRFSGGPQGASPPAMGVQWQGDVYAPKIQWDTQSSEAFVAGKNR